MNSWSNEELARRLLPVTPTALPTPLRPDAQQAGKATSGNATSPAPPKEQAVPAPHLDNHRQLSKREIEALFQALRKGTRKHLGREPTITELQSLVDAVSRARSVASWAAAAISGVLCIYAGADDWEFGLDDQEQPLAA